MIKLTIDGKVVVVEEGTTVLDAANKAGIEIPTLCYHESLSRVGSCRVCVVEVAKDGQSGLATACTYPVEAGIEVKANSEKAREARKLAVQLLLAQRPHSPRLEDLARKLGIEQPDFSLEERECILCELCVRACHEMVGVDAITFHARGNDRPDEEATVMHSTDRCIGCDSCAYVCPTEAVTVADAGDTRTLTTPSGKLQFKLKKCRVCGKYWAPEKQIEYIARISGTPLSDYDTCPDCRD